MRVLACWCPRAALRAGAEEAARVQWEDRQERNTGYQRRMRSVRDR